MIYTGVHHKYFKMAQNDQQSATSPFHALCEKLKAIDAQYNPCQCQYATLDTEDQMTARSNIMQCEKRQVRSMPVTLGPRVCAILKLSIIY